MFDSPVISLGVGMLFIYLVYGLICSAINEAIASLIELRARTLWISVVNLLDDPGEGEAVARFLYGHPLVRALNGRTVLGKAPRPAYIPPSIFSLVVVDLIRTYSGAASRFPRSGVELLRQLQASSVPQDVKRALTPLIESAGDSLSAGDNLERARTNIEQWYEAAMERTSGWYKRRVQGIILAIALILVTCTNADTLMLANHLWIDPTLRQALNGTPKNREAESKAGNGVPSVMIVMPGNGGPSAIKDNPPLLVGRGSSVEKPAATEPASTSPAFQALLGWHNGPQDPRHLPHNLTEWTMKLFGLLMTAFAASLGAPFWFDLLNRIVTIKGTGNSPEAAPPPPTIGPKPE